MAPSYASTTSRSNLSAPVPAPRRDRRADEPHRDRHRRDRHALREPAVHGRGCRCRRPAQRREVAARDQPRLARARLSRRRCVRLRPARGHERRRAGATQDGAVPGRDRRCRRRACRRGRRTGGGDAADPAALAGARRSHLVGVRLAGDCAVGRRAGHEPDELDAPPRGHVRPVRRAAGRADRALPRGVGGGRPRP